MNRSMTLAIVLGLALAATALPDSLFTKPEEIVRPDDIAGVPEARDSAIGFIRTSAALSHPYLLRSATTSAAMKLTLTAPEREAGQRPPIDVVVVLDRSGSMAAEDRIGFARRALVEAAAQLRDGDRLGIVTFSSGVSTVREIAPVAGDLGRIRDEAATITADGSTNLSGGVEMAAAMLRSHRVSGRARQILLLSDGHANIGKMGEELAGLGNTLGQEGIIVTAMGVGTDYDASTFIRLGEGSGGGYAYVTQGERIPAAIRGELARSEKRLLEDVRIVLRPAPGVTVVRALKHEIRQVGSAVEVIAPTLASGEVREILVELQVQPTNRRFERKPIVDVQVRYVRPGDGESVGRFEMFDLSLAAALTDDARVVDLAQDLDVLGTQAGLASDLGWAAASQHVLAGNYDQASQDLRRQAEELAEKNERLQSPSIADRISSLFAAAKRIESRNFYAGAPQCEAVMGQNQAALSAGVY